MRAKTPVQIDVKHQGMQSSAKYKTKKEQSPKQHKTQQRKPPSKEAQIKPVEKHDVKRPMPDFLQKLIKWIKHAASEVALIIEKTFFYKIGMLWYVIINDDGI